MSTESQAASPPGVSVVIATYNRCEDCVRAVTSALEQQPAVVEVIVCDDGSTDDTRATFERWQAREPRLRYMRLEPNRGTPAPARNLGIASARGEWIAFLDDDDRWLPGKLALQMPLLTARQSDVVGSDAVRSDGRRYFAPHTKPRARLGRRDIEDANPIILSSAVARGSLLLEAHGFDESKAIAGVEDYDLWLRLADRGARFAVIDAATVDYRDHGADRFSSARLTTQRALLRVRLRRALRAPVDSLVLRSALREVCATAMQLARSLFPVPSHHRSPS